MVEEHRAGIQFNKEMLMEEEKLLDDVESPQGDVEGGLPASACQWLPVRVGWADGLGC